MDDIKKNRNKRNNALRLKGKNKRKNKKQNNRKRDQNNEIGTFGNAPRFRDTFITKTGLQGEILTGVNERSRPEKVDYIQQSRMRRLYDRTPKEQKWRLHIDGRFQEHGERVFIDALHQGQRETYKDPEYNKRMQQAENYIIENTLGRRFNLKDYVKAHNLTYGRDGNTPEYRKERIEINFMPLISSKSDLQGTNPYGTLNFPRDKATLDRILKEFDEQIAEVEELPRTIPQSEEDKKKINSQINDLKTKKPNDYQLMISILEKQLNEEKSNTYRRERLQELDIEQSKIKDEIHNLDKNTGDIIFDNITRPAKEINKILNNYYSNIKNARTNEEKLSLIAQTHRNLELLHPFKDHNTRINWLVLNRLLAENDLPLTILENPNNAYMSSVNDWVSTIKKGQEQWRKLTQN